MVQLLGIFHACIPADLNEAEVTYFIADKFEEPQESSMESRA